MGGCQQCPLQGQGREVLVVSVFPSVHGSDRLKTAPPFRHPAFLSPGTGRQKEGAQLDGLGGAQAVPRLRAMIAPGGSVVRGGCGRGRVEIVPRPRAIYFQPARWLLAAGPASLLGPVTRPLHA